MSRDDRELLGKPYQMQAFRTFDPTVFYKKTQTRKDRAWLNDEIKKIRKNAGTDIIV